MNEHPSTTRHWCLFLAGSGAYAVALDAVAEVVEVDRLIPLPLSPPRILGLCTLRRDVIAVIGLGSSVEGIGPKFTVLVLKTGRGRWAFRVNPEGTAVAEQDMEEAPAPALDPQSILELTGTVRRAGTTYSVIDAEATWDRLRQSVEGWYAGGPT